MIVMFYKEFISIIYKESEKRKRGIA